MRGKNVTPALGIEPIVEKMYEKNKISEFVWDSNPQESYQVSVLLLPVVFTYQLKLGRWLLTSTSAMFRQQTRKEQKKK